MRNRRIEDQDAPRGPIVQVRSRASAGWDRVVRIDRGQLQGRGTPRQRAELW